MQFFTHLTFCTFAETISCDEGKKEEKNSLELGMANVGGVFLVLACGLGVSIVVGLLEFLWNVSRVSIDEKV